MSWVLVEKNKVNSYATKAKTLESLSRTSLQMKLLQQMIVTKSQLELMVNESYITKFFNGVSSYAVRSSSKEEDQELSNAGKFSTLLDVSPDKLLESCALVFSSYEALTPDSEVLIQPYVGDSDYSGVIFTSDPATGSPYFVLNYHKGFDTSTVTSGTSTNETIIMVPNLISDLNLSPGHSISFLPELIQITKTLIDILGNEKLDIEFLVKGTNIYILQVRNLFSQKERISRNHFSNAILESKSKVQDIQVAHPYLFGDYSILGVMPDWNPAELIGVRPNKLSISLFKELISNNIWAYERHNFGYRDLRSFPLLVELNGQPYIDTRVSFNSLIPKDIEKSLGEHLVNSYLEKLKLNRGLHDKIEFEITYSCFTFDLQSKIEQDGFISKNQSNELIKSLRNLTLKIISSNPYGVKQSELKHAPLNDRFDEIVNSNLNIQSKIFWLTEDCKRYGTLPFAGIARSAFIAINILKSLVSKQVISQELMDQFVASISTVTSSFIHDLQKLGKSNFLKKYGHLRPGTFDITVDSYSQGFEKYFGTLPDNQYLESLSAVNYEEVTQRVLSKISSSRVFEELPINEFDFIEFCNKSIFLREEVKFNFSRNISMILDLMSIFGQSIGYSREEMSNIDISTFLISSETKDSLKDQIKNQIDNGKLRNLETHSIWLPPLITNPEEISFFEIPRVLPNYITQKSVHGMLSSGDEIFGDILNKVVLIEGADPGFDWIFGKGISGLITSYGGVNSHMAIRANELGIPAIIGIGQQQFQIFKSKSSIYMDCLNRRFELF